MHKRRDINALSASDVQDYIHALGILRARSIANTDDPAGYDFHARRHNDMEVGPCEHGNDLFFAWHRCHLHYFEQLLRAADPPRTSNVSIPYWDWSRPDPQGGRYPASFDLPELKTNRFTDGKPLADDAIQIVRQTPGWNDFGGWPKGTPGKNYGAFESSPHNYMHGDYIGGMMGNPETAAEDSIYWSFHCFIDLLWSEWQRRNPDEVGTSLDSPLRGFAGEANALTADFQRTAALDYEYEYNKALATDFSQPSPPRLLGALSSMGSLRAGFPGSLQNQFQTAGNAPFVLPGGLLRARRTWLNLKRLDIPEVASFTLRVYIHPIVLRWQGQPQQALAAYYTGYVSLWKVHAGGGHGGHGQGHQGAPHHPTSADLRLDCTEVLLRLAAAGELDLAATLEFLPARLPNGDPPPIHQLIQQVTLSELTLEGML